MEEDAKNLFALLVELGGRESIPDLYETYMRFEAVASPGRRYAFEITLTHEPASELDPVEEDRLFVALAPDAYTVGDDSLSPRFESLEARLRAWVEANWREAPSLGAPGPEAPDG